MCSELLPSQWPLAVKKGAPRRQTATIRRLSTVTATVPSESGLALQRTLRSVPSMVVGSDSRAVLCWLSGLPADMLCCGCVDWTCAWQPESGDSRVSMSDRAHSKRTYIFVNILFERPAHQPRAHVYYAHDTITRHVPVYRTPFVDCKRPPRWQKLTAHEERASSAARCRLARGLQKHTGRQRGCLPIAATFQHCALHHCASRKLIILLLMRHEMPSCLEARLAG